MKKLLIYSLLLLPFFAFSQDDKVSFSIEKTVGISDIVILSDGAFSNSSSIAALYQGRFAYDLGGLVTIPLSDKLHLQTGAKIAVLSSALGGNELRWGTQHDGNGGWSGPDPDMDLPTSIKSVYSNFYLEIPVRLNIQLSKKSDAFQLSLGQSPTVKFLSTGKSIWTYADRTEKNTSIVESGEGSRIFNMHTQIGFIWKKEMKNNNSFYLFPNVRMQTFQQAKSNLTALNLRYLFYGLSAGITI